MTAGLSERPPAAIPVGPPVPGFPPDDLGDLAPEVAEAGQPRLDESDNRVLIDSLVARAIGGDARARDELLALIHPLVLKYCRGRLGRQESLMGSADDVAQDICMAVVSALPNYQLRGLSFRAFVYGIAAHKVTTRSARSAGTGPSRWRTCPTGRSRRTARRTGCSRRRCPRGWEPCSGT